MIPRLHVVTDDAVLQQPDFLATAQALLDTLGKDVALHLRAKAFSTRRLFEIATQLRGAPLIVINDRTDVALAARIGAVQLGSRSIPIVRIRMAMPAVHTIGYSAHSVEEAAAAASEGANFLFVGSIYSTASHPDLQPAGMQLLERSVLACTTPVLAIGGVTAERIGAVKASGAYGAAVIRAVWAAAEPVQAALELAKLLNA